MSFGFGNVFVNFFMVVNLILKGFYLIVVLVFIDDVFVLD